MSNKQDIFEDEESLKRESPLLHSISNGNPFSVPEGYFDRLPSEIIEKCKTQVEPKKWGEGILTTLLGYKWKLLTLTGCLVVICLLVFRFNDRPVSYEVMAKSIPDSLIVAHLDKNIFSLSESSLEDAQEPENIAGSVKSESDTASADQQIIAYLIDNNVSVNDIENEP
jgi:hypothetical protein